MAKTFLTAHWGHLLLFNYAAPAEALEPYLPPGCQLDLFQGSPFLSLVAFQFTNTRVLGLRWPGLTNFPEVNLRFYVRHGERRGVCFVREFVPSRLVAGVARGLYNEPYARARIHATVERSKGEVRAHYRLDWRRHQLELSATGLDQPMLPPEGSLEHFFKEHDLGVGRSRANALLTYAVEHEHWRVFPVRQSSVRLDPALYGERFAFLAGKEPHSVVFAEGSEIVVREKEAP